MSSETTPLVGQKPTQPSIVRAYWKLTRLHLWPAGTLLFFWPCMWGITMSAYSIGLSPQSIAIQGLAYLVGCTVRHNAACIWNDICDRDFDRQVERTKSRPIASGLISVPAALLFLGLHLAVLVYLFTFTGPEAFNAALFGLCTFELIYPLSKRFTNWPQAWLGFDCAWGFPVAYVSNSAEVDYKLVACFVIGIVCWTIHFDTVYACQDKKDDIEAGVHSCALLFGDWIKPILVVFCAGFVATLAYGGYLNHQGPPYYAISVGITALHLVWQLAANDIETDGGKIWKSNGNIGCLIWVGMLADYLYRWHMELS